MRRKRRCGTVLRSEDEFFRTHEMKKLPPLSRAGGTSSGFFDLANPDESAGQDPGSLSADFLRKRSSIFKGDAAGGERFTAASASVPVSERGCGIRKNTDETRTSVSAACFRLCPNKKYALGSFDFRGHLCFRTVSHGHGLMDLCFRERICRRETAFPHRPGSGVFFSSGGREEER